jgi:hypothetical protein
MKSKQEMLIGTPIRQAPALLTTFCQSLKGKTQLHENIIFTIPVLMVLFGQQLIAMKMLNNFGQSKKKI